MDRGMGKAGRCTGVGRSTALEATCTRGPLSTMLSECHRIKGMHLLCGYGYDCDVLRSDWS